MMAATLSCGATTFAQAQKLTESPESASSLAVQTLQVEVAKALQNRRFDMVLAQSEQMLSLAESKNDQPGIASAYRAQAQALQGLNRPGATDAWEKCLAVRTNLNDGVGQIECLTSLALIELSERPEEALSRLTRANRLGIAEANRPQAAANLLQTAATTLYDRGRLSAAKMCWAATLEIRERRKKESLENADSLSNLGVVATRQGDIKGAKEYQSRAQSLREGIAQNSLAVAASLTNLGNILKDQGDHASATGYYQRALALSEKLNPASMETAIALNSLGQIEREQGNLKSAGTYYRKALAIKRKLNPNSLEVATTLNSLGVLTRTLGDYKMANEYLQQALEIREKVSPDGLEVAGSLNNLGLTADKKGEIDVAEGYYSRSLTIREKLAPDSLDVSSSLSGMGNVSRYRGEFGQAEAFYQRGLEIRKRLAPNSLLVAASLDALADTARERGDLSRAEAFYNEALALRKKIAPNSNEVAISLIGLGNVARDRGDAAVSEQFYRTALNLQEKGDRDTIEMAASYTGLGNAAAERGDLGSAETNYQLSLSILRQIAPNSLDMAISHINLGQFYLRRQQVSKAQESFQKALAIQEKLSPNSLKLAVVLNNIGRAAKYQNDLATAEASFNRALAIEERLAPNALETASSLNSLSLVNLERGKLQKAEEQATRAWRIVQNQSRSLSGDDAKQEFQEYTASYSADLQTILIARKKTEEAFQIMEEGRTQSLQQLISERRQFGSAMLSPLWNRYSSAVYRRDHALKQLSEASTEQELLRLKIVQLQENQNSVELQKSQEDLATAIKEFQSRQDDYSRNRLEADQLWSELKLSLPRAFGSKMDARNLLTLIPTDTLLVAFSVGETETDLYLAKTSGVQTYRLSMSVRQLSALIERLRAELTNKNDSTDQSRLVFSKLFPAEAQKSLMSAKRLLISPSASLWKLPFAALVTNREGEPTYLGDDRPISYTQSLSLFAQSKSDRPLLVKGDKPVAVVVGNPIFTRMPAVQSGDSRGERTVSNGERGSLWGGSRTPKALPGTGREATKIAALYGAQPLLGELASEKNLRAYIESADVLHLATHGFMHPKYPMTSGVLLTVPTENSGAADTNNDGALQAWEIFSQLHLHAEIAILSACETGLGRSSYSEGVVGLTRALQYAGCRSVLASHWKVADDSTAALMTAFHQNLRQGLTKDEALRRAMQVVRKNPATSNPYYWASFFLTGDPANPNLGK